MVADDSESLVSLVQRAQALKTRESTPSQDVISSASFYVPTLPAASTSQLRLPAMYSGHLPASYGLQSGLQDVAPANAISDAHLFFLLVKANHVADREKLVIWFNGGPGCSSFDGALLEIGPMIVKGKGPSAVLRDNPGKWNEYANVLFVDQPAGTGYSYINRGRPVRELAPAAEQVVTFLSNFYAIFPEYIKVDTYLAGESYAGTTIPYLARAITSSKAMPDNLKGLLIGNGWFSPTHQYPGYVEYAEQRGFLKKKNSKQVKHVFATLERCQKDLNSTAGSHHVLVGSCEGLIEAVMQAGRSSIDGKQYCINEYDVRPSNFCGEYPPGLSDATPYLQRTDVLDAFHASHKTAPWQQCNNTVGNQMWSPQSRPSVELLPDILDTMPVLAFAGDSDLMCSYVGIERMLDALTWRGETGFGLNITAKDWYVNGTLAGTWKEARNLTWVVVKDAGHMVPINKPLEAHDILLRFIGIDPLYAAGAGSRVPSTIGTGNGGVLGKIAPDGDTLDSVKSQLDKEAAAVDKAAAEKVDKAGEEGQPIDKERELVYGPRRSAVLLLVVFTICFTIYGLLRWRARHRHRKGWSTKNADVKNSSFVAKLNSGYQLSKLSSPVRHEYTMPGEQVDAITETA